MTKFLSIFLLFAAIVLTFSCSDEKTDDVSEGSSVLVVKLSGVAGSNLFVQELRDKTWLTVDSTNSYKDSASFFIKQTETDYYRVLDSAGNMAIVILSPGQKVTFAGDLKNIVQSYQPSSSKENNQYYDFQKKLTLIRANEEPWVKKYKGFMEDPKTEDSATYYVTLLRDMQDSSDAFVKQYIDSVVPSFAVYSMVNYLRIEKEFDYLFALAARIKKEMPDSKYSRLFIGEISRMKTYKDEQAAKEAKGKVAVGKPAPNFTLSDRSGKQVSLSSLKGKYVVIDFWASWCGPCRAESPNMVKLYKKFKGKNFEILGVSLDGSEDAWNGAIEKDGLNWLHVSDLMQWNSPVVALYEIDGIPATVIVDPNGIIVAKNLRGEELMAKLDELL